MIKINLAKKRQANYSSATAKSSTSIKGLASGVDTSLVSGILSNILVPFALCAVAYFASEHYMSEKRSVMQAEIASQEKEKIRIQDELKKIKGYEMQKSEVEKTAQILRIKIETIEKLVRGKDHAVKAMIALSQSLPKEVWITEFAATESAFTMQGGTIDMGLVSDVMSKLGSSIYFKDITLKSSSIDPNGIQANFELSARRE